jgi:GH15 family glucan-1,4-alpha-glucosidase
MPASAAARQDGRYSRIGDYAVIGDCRTAGLVSQSGSLDWLCLPRFDSPSIFGALLDAEAGGRFRIGPVGPFRSERRYLPDTNILETTFHTPAGTCSIRDLMPVTSEPEKHASLVPDHQVLREIHGHSGEVDVEILYEPRPGYGRRTAVLGSAARSGCGVKLAGRRLPCGATCRSNWHLTVGVPAAGRASIDAVARFARRGGRFDHDTVRLLDGLGRTVCKRWREPDEGIWEGRSGRFHHTHSKVLCWVALDRLVEMHETGQLAVHNVDSFRTERAAIRAEVESLGYNAQIGSYTRVLDGGELDASLLLLPTYKFVDARHPYMRSTCTRIHERLGRESLIYRYETTTDDGLPPGEGAFGICSFWAVECRARGGDLPGATAAFERLLGYANDVGLYAEEIDPGTGAALGNFLQAFTHVGLINAALTLAELSDEGSLANPALEGSDIVAGHRL